MAYYNDINNIQNERVKLAFQELIEEIGATNNYNVEILMAYIIHLEEKIDIFKKDVLK